ncbi:MAG: hypothetical protein ACRC7O_00220 [Fimbriiglobus sp.]
MSSPHAPCSDCPFTRACSPGVTGGIPLESLLGRVHGPFWVPCYQAARWRPNGEITNTDAPQCAGAAKYRSNVGLGNKMPAAILFYNGDTEAVFAGPEEFVAHHAGCSKAEAAAHLADTPVRAMTEAEQATAAALFRDELARRGKFGMTT